MSELAAVRRALAADLTEALGVWCYPAPPPSISPPCAVVMPGQGYIVGPLTGCSYAVAVTVRLVTSVQENDGAYDALDDMLADALGVVGRYQGVSIAAHDYGGTRYVCADCTVSYAVDMRNPNTRERADVA